MAQAIKIEFYAVGNENMLGYIFIDSDNKKRFGILRASILRGCSFNPLSDAVYLGQLTSLRKATEKDFEAYTVSLPTDFKKLNSGYLK